MVNFIAIENASNGASVALLQDNSGVQTVRLQISTNEGKNAEQVLPLLDTLLADAKLTKTDIHGVAFSQGPGGFTGLRVACGLAQGLALGLQIPVVPVSSLEASAVLSQAYIDNGFIVVALDARMQEVYLAVYQVKNSELKSIPVLSPVLMQSQDVMAWVQEQLPRWCLVSGQSLSTAQYCIAGNALSAYPEDFVLPNTQWVVGETAWAHADTLVSIAYKKFQKEGGASLEALAPLYLRDKVAFTTIERESGLGGNPKIALPILNPLEVAQNTLATQLLERSLWIRPLRNSDLPAVIAIENVAHHTPWTEGMFFAALMHIHYHNWALVDEQDNILAYAVQLVEPDVVNLMTIAVAPSLQGQGLGELLLRWLELFIMGRSQGPYVQLLEVRVSNEKARSLYSKLGYEQIGVRKVYYETDGGREDALVLQKDVSLNKGA
ncbi:tRNA (adenosine(37)-N6)-threonylcarbamoyltransferase complex dimerization subunit type 1 TsaB [Pelistega suis]|uniref:tRNA (adenosine(37)-N6)-threonylcarbamoyltransferase complex dimerization subunit type 1 TsaB n=1 Tax=Pelistega suis TaxID=1631957 RepID=UPI00211CCCE4|nr:tRNA (adenosine(37)-N6)-threonylcarbamoyltransferase complex dimerization subunit type 1 TsaB [Pelistega suis]MCQ9328979.1 tRNA (adenosine(37)-N6)-threonylcarbamoyltransferase complex dimerization subunit type 1 TsaB [Pelistega suis]